VGLGLRVVAGLMADWPQAGDPNRLLISPYSASACGIEIAALGSSAPTSVAHGTANLARGYPFYLSEPALVAKVWWFNGATASGNIDVGVYTLDGTKLFSSGAQAQGTINVIQEFDITDFQLGRGAYYAAISCSSATATLFSNGYNLHFAKAHGWWQMATAHPLPTSVTLAAMSSSILWPSSPSPPMPVMVTTFSRCGQGAVLAAASAPTPVSTVIGAAATVLFPVDVFEPITLVKAFVMNGATVNGNFDIGIYDANLNKLFSTGSTAQAGASAIQEVDIADFQLDIGAYHLAFALSSTTAAYFAWSTSFSAVAGSNFMTAAAFPLPATFVSAGVTSGTPLFGFSTRTLVA
jgi:hypothetical protein